MFFDSIGKIVRVNGGAYSGELATITEEFPAGMYEKDQRVFMVKYNNNPNSGMFPESCIEFID